MITTSTFSRVIRNGLAIAGVVIVSGFASSALAQASRDPFVKPGYARPRTAGTTRLGKDGKPIPVEDYSSVPPVEQRIEYYKRLRAAAASSGTTMPKVTSVLTLGEMSLVGIFRTPRGYAAMVQATPINLSYTIYPGEKFFDGQLVAVEENQLIFRKVVRTGKDKFVTSVQNMPLRKAAENDKIGGPASAEDMVATAPNTMSTGKPAAPVTIVSPLDEMNKSNAPAPADKSTSKPATKPAKVARNK